MRELSPGRISCPNSTRQFTNTRPINKKKEKGEAMHAAHNMPHAQRIHIENVSSGGDIRYKLTRDADEVTSS
jgi:hypothetical protein